MWSNNIGLLFLVLGYAVGTVTADCSSCTAYDTTAAGNDNPACDALKEYVGCVQAASTSTVCPVATTTATEINKKTACTGLVAPCKCQKDFWGTPISTKGLLCPALDKYKKCLDSATTGTGCKTEAITALKLFVTTQQGSNTCSKTPSSTTDNSQANTGSTTVSSTTQKNSKGNTAGRNLGTIGMTALPIFVILKSML